MYNFEQLSPTLSFYVRVEDLGVGERHSATTGAVTWMRFSTH